MAKLQDRIKNINDYFRGMEIKNGFYIVVVQYGNKWGAYPRQDEKIKVARSEEAPNEWFYYASTDDAEIDEIFDLIDETINMNLSALAKVELLKEKIEELKILVEETSIEDLKTLKFTLTAPKKTNKRKYTKKAKKENVEPKNDENNNVQDVVVVEEKAIME